MSSLFRSSSPSPSSPVDKKPVGQRSSMDAKDPERASEQITELEKQLEVELKILSGAENLLKTVTNKKDKQEVTKKLEESSKQVELLRDKINQLTKTKATKHGQGYSLTDLDDMIESMKEMTLEEINHKIEWVNEKIKLETKVKTGAENLAKVYSTTLKDKKLTNEVFEKLMDSNKKINLLRVSLQKYKRLLKDPSQVVEIKDHKFTDEELKHWKRASLTGKMKVKIMNCTNLAPHHKKLEAKCVVKVDGKVKGKTNVKKTNAPVWNEEFEFLLEGAGELEFHILDKTDIHAILFYDIDAISKNDTFTEEKTYEMEPRGLITIQVTFSKLASALNRKERVMRRGAVKSQLPSAFIRFMGFANSKEVATSVAKEKTQRRRTLKMENKQKTSKGAEPPTPQTPSLRKKPKFEDFALVKVLGKGNFGKVMLVEEKATKNLYAIKVLKKEFVIENDEVESVQSEKRIFQIANRERHPFLVKMHSCFHSDDRIFFVMEYVSGGDLMMHIQRQLFSESRAKLYAAEVLLALEYFHKNNVVYRDLKLDNILMDLDGHIKIADYGLCKENMSYGSTTNTFCGTPEFMAPEILLEQDYDRAVDWWAFGVLIYEMILAQSPFKGDEEEEIFDSILEGNVHYPSKLHPDAVNLLQHLLEKDPKKRLGSGPQDAEEIKRHPYFKGIDWEAVLQKKVPIEFKPSISNPLDTNNFDPEFTRETPCLTPLDSNLLEVDQEDFVGFSYVAEWVDNQETYI